MIVNKGFDEEVFVRAIYHVIFPRILLLFYVHEALHVIFSGSFQDLSPILEMLLKEFDFLLVVSQMTFFNEFDKCRISGTGTFG